MTQRRLLVSAALMACGMTLAFAQYSPRMDYVWARDISVAASPVITVDGQLSEAVWAQAESVSIAYGVPDGNPGSGWKTTTLGGTPTDGPRATFKFLSDKVSNRVFIAVIVQDSSVGGAGWENADGLLAGIYDRKLKASSQVTLHRDIFVSWVDSTTEGALPNLVGGALPAAGIVTAGAWVNGVSNSDTNGSGSRVADAGYVIELAVALDSLGYHANRDTVDEVQINMCIWDVDWRGAADAIYSRVWWCNEWGNNGGSTAARILVRQDVNVNTATLPVYEPDWTIKNGANYGAITVDGNLNEDVWSAVSSFDIQYGNAALRATYPTIGKDRSGEWKSTPGQTVVNAGVTNVKMVFQGDKLFLAGDVADRSLNSFGGDEMFDGLSLSMTIPVDSLRDQNAHYLPNRRFGFAVNAGSPMLLWDGVDWTSAIAYGVALKSGSTIDNNGDVDQGYTVEASIDLSLMGYPAGQQNKTVAIGVTAHDYDVTPTSSPGTRAWWFREWPGSASPAFCVLDNSALVVSVDDEPVAETALEFKLRGAFPNPFNPSTTLSFSLAEAGKAVVVLYDVLGRAVRQMDLGRLQPGSYEHPLDGSALASGAYIARLEFVSEQTGARHVSASLRLMLVK
ncbi:MAG: hypothetical protein IT282_04505 [Bacteroidetes bacterium]|nr:hypothetical protein [Bacteroidota bacterium]